MFLLKCSENDREKVYSSHHRLYVKSRSPELKLNIELTQTANIVMTDISLQ